MDYLAQFGLITHACQTISIGDRIGRRVILAIGKKKGSYHYLAVSQCDCGSPVKLTSLNVFQVGKHLSCGCLQIESSQKHGNWKHPLYIRWGHMIDRCENPLNKKFHHYGGRGIKVCAQWHDLNQFIRDMESTFEKRLTLERINNNGDYTPENCRWATDHDQRRNRRNNIQITINGETKVLGDWCIHYGIKYQLAWERITKQGWDPVRSLTAPAMEAKDSSKLARAIRWNHPHVTI